MAELDGDMNRVFRSSFSTWLAKEPDESEEPFNSLAKAMEYFGLSTGHDKDDRPFYPGYVLLAAFALRDLAATLEHPFGQCGSPMERMLLSALIVATLQRGYGLKLKALTTEAQFPAYASTDSVTIEPQAQMGQYRVDFKVSLESLSHRLIRAEERVFPYLTTHLIVECDGHDFHDRTREQASRDRARDRWLQGFGYPVYRFTGSDIWRDVFVCSGQVLEGLTQMAIREDQRMAEEQPRRTPPGESK